MSVHASRLLVINADDLGLAPGVNRGIVESREAGTLSSASMMVNTPAFDEAVALVRERVPSLGVGLHLNLITGRPLSVAPTLSDPRTGEFYTLPELARRALFGRIDPADVRRECDAQVAALTKRGITLTHMDSHRHTHALPAILRPVLACARAAGIRFVRRPLDQIDASDPVASSKMLALHLSWRAAASGLADDDRAVIDRAPHFRGIALQGAYDVETRLLRLLDTLPAGTTEIMLHPGYDDAVLAAQDSYRAEREREVAALSSTAVRERLTRGDIHLVHFGQLLDAV